MVQHGAKSVQRDKRLWEREGPRWAAAALVLSAVLFQVYRTMTRDPTTAWIHEFLAKEKAGHMTLWVPGVSTTAGDLRLQQATLEAQGLPPDECHVAYFPYSSVVVSVDLLAALMDKLDVGDVRPQITNLQLAIALFTSKYEFIDIVCHSHGALLVRRALEGLQHRSATRIRVNAFGPAVLVPEQSPKYEVCSSVNWVNRDDILVTLRILRLPAGVTFDDSHVHQYTHGGAVYKVVARSDPATFRQWCPGTQLKPGAPGLDAHSCYPFQVGVFCKEAPRQPSRLSDHDVVDLTGD